MTALAPGRRTSPPHLDEIRQRGETKAFMTPNQLQDAESGRSIDRPDRTRFDCVHEIGDDQRLRTGLGGRRLSQVFETQCG